MVLCICQNPPTRTAQECTFLRAKYTQAQNHMGCRRDPREERSLSEDSNAGKCITDG